MRDLMRRLRQGQTLIELAQSGQRTAPPHDHEVSRVIATGPRKNGVRRVVTVDCFASARPDWQASAGDLDTGVPASIVAQMIATATIPNRGVMAPEAAVPVTAFIEELVARGLRVVVSEEDGVQRK